MSAIYLFRLVKIFSR